MKQKPLFRKRGLYLCLSFASMLLMGACNQPKTESESKTDTLMQYKDDTANPVRHMLLPESSPFSMVTQYIGITELTVRYHRPGLYNDSDALENRIPFDQIWSPGHRWVIKFFTSDTIMIKDKKLPAGSYSLLIIPGKKSWVMVFNTDTLYDPKQYDEKYDVMRVNLDAQPNTFTRDFTFAFSDITPNSTILAMNWGNVSIRMPIFINNEAEITKTFETAFSKADKDDWQIYLHAADYCLETCVNLDKGLDWINKSISIKETYANTWEKAELYAEKKDYKNALLFGEKANELGKTSPDAARQKHFDDEIALWKENLNNKQTKGKQK